MDRKNNLSTFPKQEPTKSFKKSAKSPNVRTSAPKSPKVKNLASTSGNFKSVSKSRSLESSISSSRRSPRPSTRSGDSVRQNNGASNKFIGETHGSDSVTMTRTQLNALLALIGRLDTESSDNSVEGVIDRNVNVNNPSDNKTFDNNRENSSVKSDNKFNSDGNQNAENINAPPPMVGSWFSRPDSGFHGKSLSSSPLMISLADQKKQKWTQDKTQMVPDYNPWGKPGAGAPLVAGSFARKAVLSRSHNSTSQDDTPNSSPVPTIHSSRSLPPLSQTVPSMLKPLPVALRSSLAFGDSTPQAQANDMIKNTQRQEWLRELEKQREEQLQRKLREKELDRAYFNSNNNNLNKLDTVPVRLHSDHATGPRIDESVNKPTHKFHHSRSAEESLRSTSDLQSRENLPDVLTGTPKLDSGTSTPELSAYIENRVLTPTKYRSLTRSAGRDFGTQTEPVAEFFGRRDVAVEADSDTDQFSVIDDDKASQRSKSSDVKQLPEHDSNARKPQWGVNQPERRYTKQSEKDPTYEKKRRAVQEARRRRLEQEAAIQRSRPQVGRERKSDTDTLPSSSNSFRPISDPPGSSGADTPSTTGARRQRRQWQSPVKDNLEFYNPPRSLSSPNPTIHRMGSPSPTRKSSDGHESRLDHYRNSPRSPPIPTLLNFGRHSSPVPVVQNSGQRSPPVPALLNRLRPESMMKVSSTGYHSDTTDMPTGRTSSSISQVGFIPYTRSSVILSSRDNSPILSNEEDRTSSGLGNIRKLSQPTLPQALPNHPLARSSSLPNTASLPLRTVPPPRFGSSPQRRVMTPRTSLEQDKILQQLSSLRQVLLNKQIEWEKMVGQNEVDSS